MKNSRLAIASLATAGVIGLMGATSSGAAVDTAAVDTTESTVAPQATETVGGGTWHYGWYLTWKGKACYSNYQHYDVAHGSTAIIASKRDSDWQAAGRWSEAKAEAGAAYGCSTYWRK